MMNFCKNQNFFFQLLWKEIWAGLEGPPGPLTCREKKIWRNLHHWERRWILGLPHRGEAVLGAGAGDGKAELSNKFCVFFFLYNKKNLQ